MFSILLHVYGCLSDIFQFHKIFVIVQSITKFVILSMSLKDGIIVMKFDEKSILFLIRKVWTIIYLEESVINNGLDILTIKIFIRSILDDSLYTSDTWL